jgi:hypothetical protein
MLPDHDLHAGHIVFACNGYREVRRQGKDRSENKKHEGFMAKDRCYQIARRTLG